MNEDFLFNKTDYYSERVKLIKIPTTNVDESGAFVQTKLIYHIFPGDFNLQLLGNTCIVSTYLKLERVSGRLTH